MRGGERAVAEHVDEHVEMLVDRTLDFLARETGNPPGKTSAIADPVESLLADVGLDVERFAVDGAKPNLIATLPGEGDATLCFNGHLDTVPFDREEWSTDPLGERRGDRIYGRGATDMKGAVAAMIEAARAYVETDAVPPVTLRFAFVSDEETGGAAGLGALLDAGKVEADAAVIGETTCADGRHSVTVADRGSLWLTLEATGEAAHGSRPPVGVNAIDRLYEAVDLVRESLESRSLELDPRLRPIVDDSVAYYAPSMGEETTRDLFLHPSVNLGTFDGGSAVNSVPETARAELDVRLAPGVNTATVLADVRECLEPHDRVEVVDLSWSVGTFEDPDSPLVDATASLAADVTGDRIYRRCATGGGDAKKLRNAGVPTVEFGLGTDTAHAVDEYTTVEALRGNALVYARLPYALAERLDDRAVGGR
ncbi:MAG: succinyl-diaminopimelate desuccinylase [Halobacteriales archaeon]